MSKENNSATAKIKSIEITNFRGIKSFKLDRLGKINIFVGRNSVGKTTLLEALFLNTGGNIDNIKQIEGFRGLNNDKIFQYPLNIFRNLDLENRPELKLIDKDDEKIILSVHPVKGIEKENNTSAQKVIDYETKLTVEKETTNKQKYIAAYSQYGGSDISNIRNLIRDGAKQYLIERLKEIIPNIENIEEIDGDFFIKLKEIARPLPLKIQGDGMLRIAKVIAGMYIVRNNFYLIDEIENGLYYRFQQLLWKVVCEKSLKDDVDLFITSHSYEMIQQLCKFLEKEENTKYRDLVYVHTLVKKKEKTDVISYNFKELAKEIENGFEIRGLF